MDLSILVGTVVTFLAPFLPYLTKAGEKAAEEAGKGIGEAAWDKAKALWGKLWPKVEDKPAAQEAVEDVAQAPDNEKAQNALIWQLEKILGEDADLARAIAALVEEGQRAGIIAIAVGERASAVGGDAKDTIISTGDDAIIIKGASSKE